MRYIYCHPLFDERKCAHRFSFQLSKAFEQADLKLERFDYYGTGESEGNFSEVNLMTLRRDIENKVNGQEVSLIGLRFGADLAFDYCLRQADCVKNLVLIEPLINGNAYVDYLFRKQHIKDIMTGIRNTDDIHNGFYNLEGYQTDAVFIEQLKDFSLFSIPEKIHIPTKVYVAMLGKHKGTSTDFTVLADSLKTIEVHLESEEFDLPVLWERIPDVDCFILTKKIVEWCCD